MLRVLFVCLGNICRSPTAHGVMLAKLDELGVDFVEVDSAGTIDWHQGKSPDPRSVEAAKRRSYDLSQLKARVIVQQDFDDFDFILVMDESNYQDVMLLKPADCRATVKKFLSYSTFDELDVPDPYYGGESGFDYVLDLAEDACLEFIKKEVKK